MRRRSSAGALIGKLSTAVVGWGVGTLGGGWGVELEDRVRRIARCLGNVVKVALRGCVPIVIGVGDIDGVGVLKAGSGAARGTVTLREVVARGEF